MVFNSYAEGREELAGIRLVSCGHVFAKPEREIYRPNGRGDWLLFYVAKEREMFFTDKRVVGEAGSFILYAPFEKQHHVYEGNKTAEFYYIHFKCNALPEGITLKTSEVYNVSQIQLAPLFEAIIEETLQKRPHYEMLALSRLLELFALMQREITQTINSEGKNWKSVARAIQHMNAYCDSNLGLEDYASMCCMSKFHFIRVFKEVTGTTPLEYRSRIRCEHAKELLTNSYLTVSEISETLGYSSPAYFSTVFKTAEGVTPKEYRSKKGQ